MEKLQSWWEMDKKYYSSRCDHHPEFYNKENWISKYFYNNLRGKYNDGRFLQIFFHHVRDYLWKFKFLKTVINLNVSQPICVLKLSSDSKKFSYF